jgi:hypothetical protein
MQCGQPVLPLAGSRRRHAGPYAKVARILLAWEKRQPFIKMTGGTGNTHATLRMAADTGQDASPRILLLLYAEPLTGNSTLEIHVKNMLSIPRSRPHN